MFGYIQVDKEELKVREYNAYRAYYCSLCTTLQREYGRRAKFLLNFDCTFAALVLSLLSDADKSCFECQRCPIKPFEKKRNMVKPCPEVSFAAALNVILAYYSIADKWYDDKKISALFLMRFYRKSLKKASVKYPEIANAVKNGLSELHKLERASVPDIDSAANASASMLSEAISSYPFTDETQRHIMKAAVHNLGRWIYIADAWHDRKDDAKNSNYNPVNLQKLSREQVMHMLYTELSYARDAYELLPISPKSYFAPIADNVFMFGCVKVTESVLNDTYKIHKKRKKHLSNNILTEDT